MEQTGMSGPVTEVVGEAARSGRPWWQICCGGCLLVIFAGIVGVFILMQTLTGTGVTHRVTLPPNFPPQIVPLRLDKAQTIDYFEGQNKSKMLQTIYAPIDLIGKLTGQQTQGTPTVPSTADQVAAFGTDVQHIDSVTITWKNLQTPRSDVVAYYTDQFQKAGLAVTQTRNDAERSDVVTGIEQGLFVQLSLTGGTDASVDEIVLVVSYSNKKN